MTYAISRCVVGKVFVLAVLLSVLPAQGGVVVQNGDFESPAGSGFIYTIEGWGELKDDFQGVFDDFLIAGTGPYGALNGGQSAGLGRNGYLYQEIGTPGGYGVLRVEGVNYWRNTDENQRGELTVQIYSLPSTNDFIFAESGNDIFGIGALVGTATVAAPTAQGETVSFTEDFSLAGLSSDSRLFLRFATGDNLAFHAYVDNVSASLVGPSTVPEPGSLALFAMGAVGLASGTWRKRRNCGLTGEAPRP